MAIDTGLRDLLLAQPSITALCAAQAIDGKTWYSIYDETVKQGAKAPYVLISTISFNPLGNLTNTTGLGESEIDIDCVAYTKSKANNLAKAVSDFLKDYSGPAGVDDSIKSVNWEDSQVFKQQESPGQELWRYTVTLTFTIHHEES